MKDLNHVAIIMDGNGRWATNRARPRIWGHVRGSRVVSKIVEQASELNINALTLYAFSTENWGRPIEEVGTLFKLLRKYVIRERSRIIRNDIRFKVIGDISRLPSSTKELIRNLEEETKNNQGLKLNFAFGYGGRKEIIDAMNFYMVQNPGKPITEEELERRLFTNEVGDADLLIRTGGDQRISNFLLWQLAYAELFFTQTKWPDFTTDEFRLIIHNFRKRNRRFGGVSNAQTSLRFIKNQAQSNMDYFSGYEGTIQ